MLKGCSSRHSPWEKGATMGPRGEVHLLRPINPMPRAKLSLTVHYRHFDDVYIEVALGVPMGSGLQLGLSLIHI